MGAQTRGFPPGRLPRLEVRREDLQVLVDAPEVVLPDLAADVLHDQVDRHGVVPVRLRRDAECRVQARGRLGRCSGASSKLSAGLLRRGLAEEEGGGVDGSVGIARPGDDDVRVLLRGGDVGVKHGLDELRVLLDHPCVRANGWMAFD